MDEFTYLISGNKSIPSILQKVWDEGLKDSRVFLILCGSYIGMMEREVLAYRAPLYGRRTASRYLQPVNLPTAAEFFPSYSPVHQIEAWSVLGGMPYYLQVFSDSVSLYTNIRRHILDNQGRLYNEPRLVLMEELREPRNYFSILRAIAQGRTRLNEIAQASGVGNASKTAQYLSILQEMRLVSRRVPATERQPEKSKKGIYEFTDPFLRFWFRYVQPYMGSLELGLADAVLAERVRPTFAAFAGRAFEEAARDYVARLARANVLPLVPDRIGGWWDRQAEIDVMAIGEDEQAILLGECKWSPRPLGTNVLNDLQSKARELPTIDHHARVSYALFSKSGFTPELRKLARQQRVLLVTPADLTIATIGLQLS
jgi:AAA+ ATPase superfamily predicted ATPase